MQSWWSALSNESTWISAQRDQNRDMCKQRLVHSTDEFYCMKFIKEHCLQNLFCKHFFAVLIKRWRILVRHSSCAHIIFASNICGHVIWWRAKSAICMLILALQIQFMYCLYYFELQHHDFWHYFFSFVSMNILLLQLLFVCSICV